MAGAPQAVLTQPGLCGRRKGLEPIQAEGQSLPSHDSASEAEAQAPGIEPELQEVAGEAPVLVTLVERDRPGKREGGRDGIAGLLLLTQQEGGREEALEGTEAHSLGCGEPGQPPGLHSGNPAEDRIRGWVGSGRGGVRAPQPVSPSGSAVATAGALQAHATPLPGAAGGLPPGAEHPLRVVKCPVVAGTEGGWAAWSCPLLLPGPLPLPGPTGKLRPTVQHHMGQVETPRQENREHTYGARPMTGSWQSPGAGRRARWQCRPSEGTAGPSEPWEDRGFPACLGPVRKESRACLGDVAARLCSFL